MASISTDKNGNRTIQFLSSDGKRPKIRLGKVSLAVAREIKGHVEKLASAKQFAASIDNRTASWLADIQNDSFYNRLVELGLCGERHAKSDSARLAEFIDGYISGRSTIKKSTRIHLIRCRKFLTDFYGEDRRLDSITKGDADDFRQHLHKTLAKNSKGEKLKDNTIRRTCGRAKQFFQAAEDKKLITKSPFAEMKGTNVRANRERDYFVSREEAAAVLKACPDNEWKLLFSLSRYGGLRCPSEHLELRWGDVNWNRDEISNDESIRVRSPKTAHHDGHEERIIPLWPELRPFLEAAYDELLEDFDPKANKLSEQPVIRRHRDANANLRTQLCRIIGKAGLTPWEKLFQNLRATRATELEAGYGGKKASAWMGHSMKVADKHYWQVTPSDLVRAVQDARSEYERQLSEQVATTPVQDVGRQDAAANEINDKQRHADAENEVNVLISREISDERMTPTGLEPVLPA